MSSRLIFLHCLSPMHAGVGQGTDAVDLAIARERATGLPYLPGSSIKGSLRTLVANESAQRKVFGPDSKNGNDHSGSLAFGDAHLLCLPIRSLAGTFAYVTSPYILNRLQRDLESVNDRIKGDWDDVKFGDVIATSDSVLTVGKNKVYFEDLDLSYVGTVKWVDGLSRKLARLIFGEEDEKSQNAFRARFCVVHDDVMSFLAKHGTEVVTRVSLDADTKTAAGGQLWTEENLPAESVLTAFVSYFPVKKAEITADEAFGEIAALMTHDIQFGGKATIGRGRTRVQMYGGNRK